MNSKEHLLTIRFDGPAIGPGKIPVNYLLHFLSNLNKAFLRTGRVLQGKHESIKQGSPPRLIKEGIELNLVSLTEGSPAAVLGLERMQTETLIPGTDFGMEIMETALRGLEEVQASADGSALPSGYDAGVLSAWRDTGKILSQGVNRIQMTLNHRSSPLIATFTPAGHTRIQQRIKEPLTDVRTIEGRLLMVDFKEHGKRCRIHPSIGDPIQCVFDDEWQENILDNMLQYVRVTGATKEDATTGKITSIQIRDIQKLEGYEDSTTDFPPQGIELIQGFWNSPSLGELAESQNVKPLDDVETLFGTWPDEDDDGFEEAINSLRHGITDGKQAR